MPTVSDVPVDASRRAISFSSTLVIEGDVLPRRLRRPADLLRAAITLAAAGLIFLAAYFASSTTLGLDRDLIEASSRVPDAIVLIVNLVSGFGVFLLPFTAAVELLIRRRARQLVEALAAGAAAFVMVSLVAWWIDKAAGPQLLLALTGRPAAGSVAPLHAILTATVTFITVARLVDRTRWAYICVIVVVAIIFAQLVAGGITFAALSISALLGWSIGLFTRYALGTSTTRPSGTEVAAALDRLGYPLSVLRARTETSGGRRYTATTRTGALLDVIVLDRDLEGAGILRGAWRALRIRDEGNPAGFTMRSRLEHAALQSYASQAAMAPVPRLEAVVEVGPDAALLAYTRIDGSTFAELGDQLTDADLVNAWKALRSLHDADISHRGLTPENILRAADGSVWLTNPDEGFVAAGELSLRLDLAELLVNLALLTDPDRALAAGRRVLGNERVANALPVLQPVALSPSTRRAVRKRKSILVALREGLEEISPDGEIEQVRIERLRPKTIITVILGTLAAYLLIIQLGQVNLVELVTNANWWWAAFALVLSALTYIGATMSLEGFVPERLNFWRTLQAQLAASFATLVSPPTLGAVGVNLRYLQQSKVHPALAAASIGVSQVMAFVIHILLVLLFGVIAGTQRDLDVSPPAWAIVVGVIFILALVLAFALPFTRNWAQRRIRPILRQVGPRLLTLAQQPAKLATGIGGFLLLNLGYCICLVACVRAFGGGGEWAAIFVVYLVGATVGQVAPTPGGLGAVEAAMTAGLAGVGVDAGVALSSVLLFRVFTFWLPTIPGYIAFHNLLKRGYL